MLTHPQIIKFVTKDGQFANQLTIKNGMVSDNELIPVPEVMIQGWNYDFKYFAPPHTKAKMLKRTWITRIPYTLFIKNGMCSTMM